MQNLLNDLIKLLGQDDRLVAEGKLLKNKIVELALALDPDLIKMLLKHEEYSGDTILISSIPALQCCVAVRQFNSNLQKSSVFTSAHEQESPRRYAS
jgi:Tfp pilus assembly protein PilN